MKIGLRFGIDEAHLRFLSLAALVQKYVLSPTA